MPRTHPPLSPALEGDERREGRFCQTVYGEDVEGREALALWLTWARRGMAVLKIAAALEAGDKSVLDAEWPILLPETKAIEAAADNQMGRARLGREVEAWLRAGDVVTRIDLSNEPHLRVGGWE